MESWILRIVHIVSGVLWTGWAAFLAWYLLPALGEAGPSAGAVMAGIMRRKFPIAMNVFALLSVLTGLRLYMLSFSGAWIGTAAGIVLTAGAVFALGGFAIGFTVSRPVAMRMGALGAAIQSAGGPPSPEQLAEMKVLQARGAKAARINAVHLVAAAVCMAASRAIPF